MIEIATLPKGWTTANFNECSENISLNGTKIKQKQYLVSGKFPVIDQGRELIGGYSNDELLVVPNEPPYIVFGDHTKVKKFVTFKFIAGADGVKVLKPHHFILPKLFYYFIHAVKIPDKGYARHYQFLAREKFPIPPLNEQKRILAKLEQLLTDLDKGIEYLETTKQQLKVYRQAVLKWAFEGKFTNSGFEEFELKSNKLGAYIERIEAGKSFKCEERPPSKSEYGVLKVSAITWGKYDENESKTITDHRFLNERFLVKIGDFIFSRANTLDLIGAVVIANNVSKNIMLSDKTLRIIFSKHIVPEYVLYYLRSKEGRKQIQFYSNGNQESMRNIGQTGIKSISIPIPQTTDLQTKIVKEIESRLSVCDKIEETIESSLQQAEALRLSIIKKAFEGKLVPQDPNDEPAEKLLERIKALRQSSTKLTSRAQGKQGNGKPDKKEKEKEKVKAEKKVKIPKKRALPA